MNLWKTFALLTILAFSFFAAAAPAVPADLAGLAAAATSENYPDADTALLFDREEVTFNPDGSSVATDHMCYKILTEKGRRAMRSLPLYFHTAFDRISVETCEIIRPGGRTIAIDIAANTRIMTDDSQMGANIYDPNNKILMLTIPDLQVGDILNLKVRDERFKSRIRGVFSDVFSLQSDMPILRYEVIISAPEDHPLRAVALKDEVPGTVKFSEKRDGGRIVYEWIASNVPAVIPEPDMPPVYMCSQRLLVSTAPDWPAISRWYFELARPHIEKVTPAIKAQVAELIKGAATPEEKLMAIFQFVSQKIRYMGITPETASPGYEPHDVDMTFDNRYGVCRDKAALLAAMLNEAGFEAYPALFYVGPVKDAEVPNNFFNHAVTAVRISDGYILMDPTYETTTEFLPAAESEMSYLVATPSGEKLLTSPPAAPEKNRLSIDTEASVDAKGTLHAASVLDFDGVNDQIYRDALSRWSRQYCDQFFGSVLKSALPGAVLDQITIEPADIRDMSKKLRIRLDYRAENYFDPAAKLQLLEPAYIGKHLGAAALFLRSTALEKRHFPLRLHATAQTLEKFSLTVPAGHTAPPAVPSAFTDKTIDYSLRREDRKNEDGATQFENTRSITLRQKEVSPEDYAALKNTLRRIETAEKHGILLRRDAAAALTEGGNAELIRQNTVIDLKSPQEWVETTSVEKKILSYAGVKENSELSIPFNPVWEKVEILDAEVISPDGATAKLAPHELNLMDQGWVGAAPAYPAGKILVANFPAVKIGSTIKYTIKREFFNRPFFSGVYSFAAPDPARNMKLTLNGERGNLRIATTGSLELRRAETPQNVSWEREDFGATANEPFSPPEFMFEPTLFLSSAAPRDYAADLNKALLAKSEDQPAAAKLSAELTKDCKTDAEKIRAIRDYVAINIRAAGPGAGELPYSLFSTADATLERRYGNNPDRAILLYSMLKAAGLKPEFIAVSDIGNRAFEPDTPLGGSGVGAAMLPPEKFFTTILVRVGKTAVLNANSQYGGLRSDPNAELLALDLASGKFFDNSYGLKNATAQVFDIALKADGGATVKFYMMCSGSDAEAMNRSWSEMTPERRRRYAGELASSLAQNAVVTEAPSAESMSGGDVFSIKAVFEIPDFMVKDGDFAYFKLPQARDIANRLPVAGTERRNPLYSPREQDCFKAYMFSAPEGYELSDGGGSFLVKLGENPVARRKLRYNRESGKWLLDFQSFRPDGFLAPEHYPALIAVRRRVASPGETVIMFKKIEQR